MIIRVNQSDKLFHRIKIKMIAYCIPSNHHRTRISVVYVSSERNYHYYHSGIAFCRPSINHSLLHTSKEIIPSFVWFLKLLIVFDWTEAELVRLLQLSGSSSCVLFAHHDMLVDVELLLLNPWKLKTCEWVKKKNLPIS